MLITTPALTHIHSVHLLNIDSFMLFHCRNAQFRRRRENVWPRSGTPSSWRPRPNRTRWVGAQPSHRLSANSKYFLSCLFSLLATFSIPSSCWSRRRTETSRRPNRIARSREWWTRRDQTRVDNNQCENASFKDSTIPLIGQHCRAQTDSSTRG